MIEEKKSVFVIRHGATKMNHTSDTSQDRIRGWADVPLSTDGKEDAHKVADKVKDTGITHLITSDLKRAHETANIIGKKCGLPVMADKCLRPWDLGELTGKSTKDSLEHIAKYARNPDTPVPKGESFNSFKKRLLSGLDKIKKAHSDKTIGLVTHHRVERLLNSLSNNGDVDLDTFLQKGEHPGTIQKLRI